MKEKLDYKQLQYAIKSEKTQQIYQLYLKYFTEYIGYDFDEFSRLSLSKIQDIIIKYIIFMRSRNLAYQSIKGRLSPIFTFLELNDITVNRKKINKYLGEQNRTIKDEAYTHEDLLKMFEVSSFRTRLIISIYSSTGIRKSALLDLKLRHISKIKDVYKFTIYENSKEEYYTFCTPECCKMIDKYIEQRQKAGEKISRESYLVRNDFNESRISYATKPKKVTVGGLNTLMKRTLIDAGIKEVSNGGYQRQPKALFHAFRKYFNTTLANCDVNPLIKEMLMGHSLGLDDNYYRPNQTKVISEYYKAINDLTINEENRLKKKISELEIKQDRIEKLVERIEKLEIQKGLV